MLCSSAIASPNTFIISYDYFSEYKYEKMLINEHGIATLRVYIICQR